MLEEVNGNMPENLVTESNTQYDKLTVDTEDRISMLKAKLERFAISAK